VRFRSIRHWTRGAAPGAVALETPTKLAITSLDRRSFVRSSLAGLGAAGLGAAAAPAAFARTTSAAGLAPAVRAQVEALVPAAGPGVVAQKAFACQIDLGIELVVAAVADGFPLFLDFGAAAFAMYGFTATIVGFHQDFPTTPSADLATGIVAAYQYLDAEAVAVGIPVGFSTVRLVATSPVQLGIVDIEAEFIRNGVVVAVAPGFADLDDLDVDSTRPPNVNAGVGINTVPVGGDDTDSLLPPGTCKKVYGTDSSGNSYCWDTCSLTEPPN